MGRGAGQPMRGADSAAESSSIAMEAEHTPAVEEPLFHMEDVPMASPVRDGSDTANERLTGPRSNRIVTAAAIVEAFQKLECEKRDKLTPASFETISVIGAGAYGKVFLVKKKDGTNAGRTFAMKVLKKGHIVKSKTDIKHTNAERKILAAIHHPHIVDLHYAFQTECKLYMVLQYAGGGDLFNILDREGMLSEGATRFYAAELICALEHIHNSGVVYRDLKPENILLETNGHIKLTDFGLAKALQPNEKTYTICGTYEYMAPEVVRKSGHNIAADYWSLGALLYDMLTGCPPFTAANRWKLMEKIVSAELAVPQHLSRNCVSLLGGLMNRSVRYRLGSAVNGGVKKLKSHCWFSSIDWDGVPALQLKPPFVPMCDGDSDVRNFDSSFTSMLPRDTPDQHIRLNTERNPFEAFSFSESPMFNGLSTSDTPAASDTSSGCATPIVNRNSPVPMRDELELPHRVLSEPVRSGLTKQFPIQSWQFSASLDSTHGNSTPTRAASPPMVVPTASSK